MRFKITAAKVNFDVTDEDGASLLHYSCEHIDYSVDVAGLLDALPALGAKINDLATQSDGK